MLACRCEMLYRICTEQIQPNPGNTSQIIKYIVPLPPSYYAKSYNTTTAMQDVEYSPRPPSPPQLSSFILTVRLGSVTSTAIFCR